MKKTLVALITISLIIIGLIFYTYHSSTVLQDEMNLPEITLPEPTNELKVEGAKYIVAFSEANANKENKGAFFTIDKNSKYTSRSIEMEISSPIAFKQQNNKAYLVNNSSNSRFSIDLTIGTIKPIEVKQQHAGQSFTLQTNKDYVIYDVATDYTKQQQLVYWKVTNSKEKKIANIPNGFAQSIYLYKNLAYISTSNPDATTYIHQIDLNTGQRIQSKKLKLESEEYIQSGLPSNQSLILFNKKLYLAVTKTNVIAATTNNTSDDYLFKGRLIQLNPQTLEIEDQIVIDDTGFKPDTLAVIDDHLVILDTFEKAYVMNKNKKITPMHFKMEPATKSRLEKMETMTEQITIKNQKAYIFTQYAQNEKNRGEINAFDLKNGKHLSRTIIPFPMKNYYLMNFAVVE